MRKTPIEQAIAMQTDRRLRYDQRMRESGNRRVTLWCPEASAADLRELARLLTDATGKDAAADLAALVTSLREAEGSTKSSGSHEAGGRDAA